MNVLDYILEGLEAELELERELGVRFFEFDRSLLAPHVKPAPSTAGRASAAVAAPAVFAPSPARPMERPAPRPQVSAVSAQARAAFVFLHDQPLSPAGAEMMDKIVAALGQTPESAPVVHEGALPAANAYIVLGSAALKKWFPGERAAPGQWLSATSAKNVLVTYSPTYILRFGAVTPAVQKIKKEMWVSLKSVLQRIRSCSV